MIKKGGLILWMMLLILSLVAMSAIGWADELNLVKGKGIEVCEAYQKDLQGRSLQDMVCGEKEDTEDFKRPKWEKLDLRENRELVKKIHKFFEGGDQFAKVKMIDDDKQFEKLMDQIYTKMDALYKTLVDIDNDGKPEKLMLYQDAICMYTRAYSRPLFVLDDEVKNQIDVKKTELLMQNISKSGYDIKSKAIESLYRLYDVFSYKDEAYFDKWFIRDWTLTVYKQSKGKVKEVCKYKYEQKNLKNKEENSHEN